MMNNNEYNWQQQGRTSDGQAGEEARSIPTGRPQFQRNPANVGGSTSSSYRGGSGDGRKKVGSPWEGTSGFHGKLADYVPLTEVGYEFPFKKALLARYRPDAALPAGKQSTLTATEELMRGIWVAEPLGPVSFEPFNEEEQKAVSTGNFCNFHKRVPPGGSATAGNAGGHHRYNRQNQQQQPQDDTRQPAARPYHPHNEEQDYFARRQRPDFLAEEKPKGRSLMSETRRRELAAEKTHDKALEERFNAPLNSRKGNPTGSMPDEPVLVSRVVASLSDLEDDGDYMTDWVEKRERKDIQGKVQEDIGIGRPAVIESAFNNCKPTTEPFSLRQAAAEPFSFGPGTGAHFGYLSSKTAPELPAYSAPIIPSSSPILRQSSPTIHPTTQWLYRDPAGQLQGPFTNAKMLDWYNRQYFPENLPLRRQEDTLFMPLSEWKQKYGGKAPFETAQSEQPSNNYDLPRSVQLGTASSPLAGFFDLNLNLAQPPSTSASKPNVPTTKNLSEEESRFLSQLGLFSINDKPAAPSAAPIPPAQPVVKAVPATPTGPAWGALPQVQTAKLDEQKPPFKQQVPQAQAPIPTQRPLVPASSSGWCKPASPTAARPLEEILAEEERQAASRPKQTSQAPKSFADLMKSASTTPTATAAPIQQGGKPGYSPKPTVIPSATTQTSSHPTTAQSLTQWAQESLRPLAPLYDIDTCVSLILALPTPEETVSFIRANIRTDRINMDSFIHTLISRRWGPSEATKHATSTQTAGKNGNTGGGSGLVNAGSMTDEDFVTVDRRKPAKK